MATSRKRDPLQATNNPDVYAVPNKATAPLEMVPSTDVRVGDWMYHHTALCKVLEISTEASAVDGEDNDVFMIASTSDIDGPKREKVCVPQGNPVTIRLRDKPANPTPAEQLGIRPRRTRKPAESQPPQRKRRNLDELLKETAEKARAEGIALGESIARVVAGGYDRRSELVEELWNDQDKAATQEGAERIMRAYEAGFETAEAVAKLRGQVPR